MLDVAQALSLVLARSQPLPARLLPLADSLGCVLAQPVRADIDSPPYDKALVDGYAVQAADLASGIAEFRVLEQVTAGEVPQHAVTPGTATRIMTGAPLPQGANAVVMIEHSELVTDGNAGHERVRLQSAALPAGANILPRGRVMRRGDEVLPAGRILRAADIGLLAEVGASPALVIPRPLVALLATGNELVPSDQTPGAGQIRNSNGPMLRALVEQAGGRPLELGIARDEPTELRRLCAQGLAANVLVLAGGVSAGVLDLVPQTLRELGVETVFHKVRLKPGQPLWFGVAPANQERPPALVFGLPGNPVSSLVCFELFVRPALARLAGRMNGALERREARLMQPFSQRGARPTYFPALWENAPEGPVVTPLPWQGSADLRTLAQCNALALFPAGERDYAVGESVEVVLLP